MEDSLQEIASYATIGPGNIYPNACYEINQELSFAEKPLERPSKEVKNHSYGKVSLYVIITILVLVSIAISVGLTIKVLMLSQSVSSLQFEIDAVKVNLTDIVQAVSSTGLHSSHPAESCSAILRAFNKSESGYFWIKTSNKSSALMFCDMERRCGGIGGGWTRVANLNITDPNVQCPPQLQEHTYLTDRRTCKIPPYIRSCVSVFYNMEGIEYSRVCGRILAYQYGSTDSFYRDDNNYSPTIDSNYVDGISLTRANPREHIWTLAAGYCMEDCYFHSPPFILNHYFCDGLRYPNCTDFCDVTLWNGEHCDPQLKWFYNQLPQRKSDAIEMRLCQNEGSVSEQTPIVEVELYIQ